MLKKIRRAFPDKGNLEIEEPSKPNRFQKKKTGRNGACVLFAAVVRRVRALRACATGWSVHSLVPSIRMSIRRFVRACMRACVRACVRRGFGRDEFLEMACGIIRHHPVSCVGDVDTHVSHARIVSARSHTHAAQIYLRIGACVYTRIRFHLSIDRSNAKPRERPPGR